MFWVKSPKLGRDNYPDTRGDTENNFAKQIDAWKIQAEKSLSTLTVRDQLHMYSKKYNCYIKNDDNFNILSNIVHY